MTDANQPAHSRSASGKPDLGDATQDLRKHAEEALRLLSRAQVEAAIVEADDEGETYDLKDAARAALNMTQQTTSQPVRGAAHFSDDHQLKLLLGDEQTFVLSVADVCRVGRGDIATETYPDVDLGPHGAYRLGVSRYHAEIRRSGNSLLLVDLSSRNGTSINGRPLPPDQPFRLHDGDTIHFGDLPVTIRFVLR